MSQGRSASPSDRRQTVRRALEQSARLQLATWEPCGEAIVEAAEVLIGCLRGGGRVLTLGNGGSAADAQHLAAELAGRFDRDRPGLPVLALTANSSDLTAIGNDYGFERVFSRLVQAHGRAGDAVVAISTSGRSANVVAAVEAARDAGVRSVGLLGKGGGALAGLVDVAVVVPSDSTPRVQEVHAVVIHVWCELVEGALFPGSAPA